MREVAPGNVAQKILNRRVVAKNAEGLPWHVIPSPGKLHIKDLCIAQSCL